MITTLTNADAVARAGAERFLARANEAVARAGVFTVALSGGSTPRAMFRILAHDTEFADVLPWEKIQFFWSDERHVPPDSPDSNYRMAAEEMLRVARVSEANIHRVLAELGDAGEAAALYERELIKIVGAGDNSDGTPQFDLLMLGIGLDGHTASIFPGSPLVLETQKLVAAVWEQKLNSFRISMTPPVLEAARNVMILAAGKDKAVILKKILEGTVSPEQLPAQLIRMRKRPTEWMLDEAASSLLSHKSYEPAGPS